MASVFKYKYFIGLLTKVNVLVRYRKTRLGVLWMLLTPVLTVVIWGTLHKAGIFNPGDTGLAYPAFVFFSSTLWAFFFEGYKAVSESVNFHSKLLLSHKIPYGTVIMERSFFHMINSVIPLLINIPVLLLFGARLGWTALLFPLAILPLLMMGIALGMFVAVLKVVAVDFSNAIDELIKVSKYLAPVVYASNMEMGFLSDIIKWNPMTYLINMPRELMLNQDISSLNGYLLASLLVLVLFLLAWRFYIISAPLLVERLFGN